VRRRSAEPFGGESSDPRHNLAELSADLRARLLALDEPVKRDDWAGVVRRGRALEVSGRLRSSFVAGLSVFVMVASVSLLAVRLTASDGGDGGRAPLQSVSGEPSALTAVGGVKPLESTGPCYRWDGAVGRCRRKAASLGVSWSGARVVGSVSRTRVSSVRIKFSDGSSVAPDISWVSARQDVGSFSYAIPEGKVVTEVATYERGHLRSEIPWYAVS
jgi:hypothetical protein